MPATICTFALNIIPSEAGGYVVTVPALPGCATQGETYEEAIAMAKEAIELYLEVMAEDGEQIPDALIPPPGSVCIAVELPEQR